MVRRLLAGAAVPLVVIVVAVVAVQVGGVSRGGDRADDPERAVEPTPTIDDVTLTAALQPFDSCDALGGYYRDAALELVGPYGLTGPSRAGFDMGSEDSVETAEAAAADTAATVTHEGQAVSGGSSPTGTNVQEAGVDEPDLFKTNGTLAVAVAGGRLQVTEVLGTQPEWLGSAPLPDGWSHELLLDGGRVLVLTRGDGGAARAAGAADSSMPGPMAFAPMTTLTLMDLTDPAQPRTRSSLTLDGEYRSARLADGTARVVVHAPPVGLPFTAPEAGGLRDEREAAERNREVVRDSEATDWLPWSVRRDGDGEVVDEGPLFECGDVRYPQEFSGLATLAVLSVDLDGELRADGGAAVVADGETVYASQDTLYVATSSQGPWSMTTRPAPESVDDATSQIHAFDLAEPGSAPYLATGDVDGWLLNSYAMSEHDGVLRVATTTSPQWLTAEPEASESQVTTLRREGERLEEVGRVGGLGKGERIYAVRYLGDQAAVVTFRQTDPLYMLDLADPTEPTVEGELKITGYSAYLHPVGDDLLLGVGQDADEQGRLQGVQVSLFDVADPAAPTRVDQVTPGQGYSPVENDPHAFLYAAEAGLAVVPIELFPMAPPDGSEPEQFAGALGLRVVGDTLEEAGRVSHPEGGSWHGVQRALVRGDVLYTMSERGVQANDLETLDQLGFADFRR